MVTAALLALGSAMGFAACSVIQWREAQAVERHGVRLFLALLRRPNFLAGLLIEAVAFVLQALALGIGAVVVVQPLLVTGLLFALPLSARAESRSLTGSEALGMLCCATGIAVFVVVSDPAAGTVRQSMSHGLAITLPLLAVAAAAAALARIWITQRAVLLGMCSGVLVGLGAGLLKLVMHGLASRGPAEVISWQVLALVVIGAISVVSAQSTFQAAGRLGAPLAMLTLAEPVTAVIVGVGVLHERISTAWPAIAAETVAALVSGIGVILLATSQATRRRAGRDVSANKRQPALRH